MKLDRNTNPYGRGKYALIKLRECPHPLATTSTGEPVIPPKALDWGGTPDTEFFVIRLRDRFASPALNAYANALNEYIRRKHAAGSITAKQMEELEEYRSEIKSLAEKALVHTMAKIPD